MMLRVFSITTRRETYGELSVVFLILSHKHKNIYDFSISKLLANFRVFDRFRKNFNYKRLWKKIVTYDI